MKTRASFFLLLACAGSFWAMDERGKIETQQSSNVRTVNEQEELDNKLIILFESLPQAPESSFQVEGNIRKYLDQGSTLTGDFALDIINAAVNHALDTANFLPLLILFEQGLDPNWHYTATSSKKLVGKKAWEDKLLWTIFFKVASNLNYSRWFDQINEDDMLPAFASSPRGPFDSATWDDDIELLKSEESNFLNLRILDWLLEQGANIDALDKENNALLIWSAFKLLTSPPGIVSFRWQTTFNFLLDRGSHVDLDSAYMGTFRVRDAINRISLVDSIAKLVSIEKHREAIIDDIERLFEQDNLLEIAIEKAGTDADPVPLREDLEQQVEKLIKRRILLGETKTISRYIEKSLNQELLPKNGLARILILATGQGRADIVSYILDNHAKEIGQSSIQKAIRIAAMSHRNHRNVIFYKLTPHLQVDEPNLIKAISGALLGAAAQGNANVVSELVALLQNALLYEYTAKGDPEIPQYLFEEMLEVFDYALTRASRQGHDEVLQVLIPIIAERVSADQSNLENSTDRLHAILGKSLRNAAIQRHGHIVSLLLTYKYPIKVMIPVRPSIERLEKLLLNPFLIKVERDDYAAILEFLKEKDPATDEQLYSPESITRIAAVLSYFFMHNKHSKFDVL